MCAPVLPVDATSSIIRVTCQPLEKVSGFGEALDMGATQALTPRPVPSAAAKMPFNKEWQVTPGRMTWEYSHGSVYRWPSALNCSHHHVWSVLKWSNAVDSGARNRASGRAEILKPSIAWLCQT